MRLYESFNFSEGFIGVAKIAFSLERQIDFFPVSFILRPRRKYTRKKTRRNSVKNARKIIENQGIN